MRGHIRKKGKRWYIVIFIGYNDMGKERYKWHSGYRTRDEAEKDLPNKLKEMNEGSYVETNKQTMSDYIQEWMKIKETQVRPNTFRTYDWLVRTHVIPNLGKIQIKKLQPNHLQSLYAKLATRDPPLSNRTIQQVHVLLHDALGRALKWGIVSRNIAELVDAPRVKKSKGKSWDSSQVVKFLGFAKDNQYHVAFVLAIMTGMRKGEILALRWKDIDMERGYASVTGSLTFINSTPVFQQPKTDQARRSVALSSDVIQALRQHKARQNESRLLLEQGYTDDDLIVCRYNGRPLNPRNLDDAWYSLLEKSGLPRIRFHDLRHTHASLMLEQGVHPKIVSERLGHSNINITLDIYSHVLPGLQKQAADNFSESLRQTKA